MPLYPLSLYPLSLYPFAPFPLSLAIRVEFGLSTHIVYPERLSRRHLDALAESAFTRVELFALRSHFDYHDPGAVQALRAWLSETGLALHSVHAPITNELRNSVWGEPFSIGASDASRRTTAVQEAARALAIADEIPYGYLVVHVGVPDQYATPDDNRHDAVRRSLEELQALAAPRGVHLALEVIPNALSTPDALVRLVDEELEIPGAGLCFDFGHAFLMGDVVDGIEACSGHLLTTHVHDNGGTRDDHLLPFRGGIDWASATTALQKIGYDGALVLELAASADLNVTLDAARDVRHRLEPLLDPAQADWNPWSGL
ncbi:MAG: TIM barrel protein [Luteitalea sp.]|nr:TIM barrel protein [Luteitalea sp.]